MDLQEAPFVLTSTFEHELAKAALVYQKIPSKLAMKTFLIDIADPCASSSCAAQFFAAASRSFDFFISPWTSSSTRPS